MSGPAIVPGVCRRCGDARNAGDVTDPDDGLCSSCCADEFSVYLAEVATRGERPTETSKEKWNE